ncbi:polymorphic toxin-type HINT domain-containing protein [Streptomyces laculatispora]|uniref:Polymorphic toxin-type HINT domain-containing protein n=1 Tax=Streptomyces laculatispora TaxID=887464 RepID=A0ABY9I308_9ACTN|nr:polymorphic toxin-type HINT domain-containing protein [Streptomyces laculatispora]WLQ40999.1 polymorphic toxin-type HINT domain-containing protein [Streptomyces laculatispora]
MVLIVAAVVGAMVATGIGQTLTDKIVAQVSCIGGGGCDTGDPDPAAEGRPPQGEDPAGGDVPATDAPLPGEPPLPPAKSQAQLDFEAAQQELETARTDQRTSEDKAKAIAVELAKILADELGLKNPFDCVMKQDLGTCGDAVIDVLLNLIGGSAGKFAKKYWKPQDWKKGAGRAKKVVNLSWDLKNTIGKILDARGKVKAAESKLASAKTKFDAEKAAKPKPQEPKKPERPDKPDDDEEPDECQVPHSFLGGTPVLFGDGKRRPIENVRLGDRVVATDPVTGRTALRPVTRTFRTTDDKHFTVLTVRAGDRTERLTATDTHPFWLTDQGRWVDAGDITAGAALRTPAGHAMPVTAVRHYTQRQTTYDLTVDEIHAYYVGAGSENALVHNVTCGVIDLDEAHRRFPGQAHTLDEHVDVSPGEMRRLAERKGINSQWVDKQTAQLAVNEVMSDPKIQAFIQGKLAKMRNGENLTLPVKTFGEAGTSLGTFRKKDGTTGSTGNKVTITIQKMDKDAFGRKVPGGYYVYTAFPV